MLKDPQGILEGSQVEKHWARGSLVPSAGVPELVTSAWPTLRKDILESGALVTWKRGHQLSCLIPGSEGVRALAEPQRDKLSLPLCPAESPHELSFHSLPTRARCSPLPVLAGSSSPTATALGDGGASPGCPQTWPGCPNPLPPQSFRNQGSKKSAFEKRFCCEK